MSESSGKVIPLGTAPLDSNLPKNGGRFIDIEGRLSRLETKIEALATREDLLREINRLRIWILGGVITTLLGSPALVYFLIKVVNEIQDF